MRGVGGSSGQGTNNKYKHCKEDPADSNYIICKDKCSGKKIRKKKPADWNDYKRESPSSPPIVVPGGARGGGMRGGGINENRPFGGGGFGPMPHLRPRPLS